MIWISWNLFILLLVGSGLSLVLGNYKKRLPVVVLYLPFGGTLKEACSQDAQGSETDLRKVTNADAILPWWGLLSLDAALQAWDLWRCLSFFSLQEIY